VHPGSYANPLYVVKEGPGVMGLELDQAEAQSHSHPQRQVHPIPLYESDNYIYYVEGLQSLQWILLYPWTSQNLIRVLKANYFHLLRKKIPQIEIMA
jgi:hypothetical protein